MFASSLYLTDSDSRTDFLEAIHSIVVHGCSGSTRKGAADAPLLDVGLAHRRLTEKNSAVVEEL